MTDQRDWKLDLVTIKGAFVDAEGFPRPQWEVIGREIAIQMELVYGGVARQWLELLRDSLDENYHITETTDFLFLSACTESVATKRAEWCESSLAAILDTLGAAVECSGQGKHVVMQFATQKSYYDYICYFDSDGEYPTTGGMYIPEGHGHIVLPPIWDECVQTTIIHEMTHLCLRHLEYLPAWLNEGLAKMMEQLVWRASPPDGLTDREYWVKSSLQGFWSGESFYDVDGQGPSYPLALYITQWIFRKHRQQFIDFVIDADWRDAGQGSLQHYCGVTLGQVVEQILGDGNWDPTLPITMETESESV